MKEVFDSFEKPEKNFIVCVCNLNGAYVKKSKKALAEITKAKNAVKANYSLWSGDADLSLNAVLKEVFSSGIFLTHDVLLPIANRLNPNVA